MDIDKNKWKGDLGSEVSFWDKWFKTKGLRWPDDYSRKIDPETSLQEIFEKYSDKFSKNKILDVGAGPLTIIGKKSSKIDFEIYPVDPLGESYSNLLRKYKIKAPVKTISLEGEKLSQMFKPDTFNISYSSNAIDHSYDPLKIIKDMIKVTKPGGAIILHHRFNVGSHADWKGMHNWDFFLDNNLNFIIRGKNNKKVNVNELFKKQVALHEIRIDYDKQKFITVFKKII